MADTPRPKKRSLIELITDVPTLVRELVEAEFEYLKSEVIRKLKAAGIGVGLIAIAGVFLLLLLGVLLTSAILALALVMPGWLAALVVAAVLVIIIAVLAFFGVQSVKKGIPPYPVDIVDHIKNDINVIKGVGKRATS
jgi:hypothetical protein